jgi:hypothetical protein
MPVSIAGAVVFSRAVILGREGGAGRCGMRPVLVTGRLAGVRQLVHGDQPDKDAEQ